jgi:hypothetical protein
MTAPPSHRRARAAANARLAPAGGAGGATCTAGRSTHGTAAAPNGRRPRGGLQPEPGAPRRAWGAGRVGSGRIVALYKGGTQFVPPFIHLTPALLRDSVPLFLMRQCDRTLGPGWRLGGHAAARDATRSGEAPALHHFNTFGSLYH